ncbi:MAG: tail fiber protein [Cytophagales bacterium]|nr:tail fiber protein [Cytophagales bacterium]
MEGVIGEIRMFAGNFAPRAWAFCEGQLQSIAQNNALFSILGTTYGGDGRTTFALPDLRGRTAIAPGTGPGLSTRKLGARSGQETITLGPLQMPAHNHLCMNINLVHPKISVAKTANTSSPENAYPADAGSGKNNYNPENFAGTTDVMALAVNMSFDMEASTGSMGGGKEHNNMQPFLAVNYIICLAGVFPSRS